MRLDSLISAERAFLGVRASEKSQLLGEIGRRAASHAGLEAAAITAALAAREKLGSTGFGRGFALPHARLDGLKTLFGLFFRLAKPVDFAAIDGQKVDLVFALLIPSDAAQDHVAALAAVARAMRDDTVTAAIRRAADPASVLDALRSGDAGAA